MQRINPFYIILLLLIPAMGAGQQIAVDTKPIQVKGVVVDAQTQAVIPNVQYSIMGRGGGVTDAFGQFLIFALRGDSIEFRMVGYKPSILKMLESHNASGYLVLIAMVTDTLLVGEVVILPQLPDIRTIANTPTILDSREYENARNNLAMSVHQALTTERKLTDPRDFYDVQREKHKVEAYEKGGIPSDRMVALSPLMIIPAYYLLMNGFPEAPKAPVEKISYKDLERLRKAHQDQLLRQK